MHSFVIRNKIFYFNSKFLFYKFCVFLYFYPTKAKHNFIIDSENIDFLKKVLAQKKIISFKLIFLNNLDLSFFRKLIHKNDYYECVYKQFFNSSLYSSISCHPYYNYQVSSDLPFDYKETSFLGSLDVYRYGADFYKKYNWSSFGDPIRIGKYFNCSAGKHFYTAENKIDYLKFSFRPKLFKDTCIVLYFDFTPDNKATNKITMTTNGISYDLKFNDNIISSGSFFYSGLFHEPNNKDTKFLKKFFYKILLNFFLSRFSTFEIVSKDGKTYLYLNKNLFRIKHYKLSNKVFPFNFNFNNIGIELNDSQIHVKDFKIS